MLESTLAALEAAKPIIVEFLRPIVAELVAEARPSNDADDLMDQAGSPLGRRTHINLARDLVGRGEPGAYIKGRRHYLTRATVKAALAKKPARPPSDGGAPPIADEYCA